MINVSGLGGLRTAAVISVVVTALLGAAPAGASVVNKLVFTGQFGREVDLTQVGAHAGPALEDVCTVESGDTCQPGTESAIAGGFLYPEGVAVGPAPSNYVYVADKINGRVQVFTPAGAFVSMFGWEVNETKVAAVKAKGGSPTPTEMEEENVCPVSPGNVCRGGQEVEPEGPAGQIARPVSIVVDQNTGNVYVWDKRLFRVSEYTATGRFILMIGREVNETEDNASGTEAQKNLCTAEEVENLGVKCKRGEESTLGSTEHGGFKPETEHGNILAFGGPQHLLYVGDEERVQEFEETGKWVREIPLNTSVSGPAAAGGTVKALAVDPSGSVYLVYNNGSGEGSTGIRKLNASGALAGEIDGSGNVYTFALDSAGHIAATEVGAPRGVLLDASSGKQLSQFAPAEGMGQTSGLAFSANGDLYGADYGHQDIDMYATTSAAFLLSGPVNGLTATSATLTGEVNPNEVDETRSWFQYGTNEAFGSETEAQPVATGNQFVPLEASVALIPNQRYFYRIAAEDKNDHAPAQPVTGETLSFATPVVPPQIPGQPSASAVTAQSAVLNASVNPEHLSTRYRFEYGACPSLSGCATVQDTPVETSAVYGEIGTTRELVGLAPTTTYSFRLVASNEFEEAGKTFGGKAAGVEGVFTTAPTPLPRGETGAYSAVTPTSATISGMVDPDGLPASYAFEFGVYNEAATQYGVVFSGSAGSSRIPVEETLPLTGLQPGTTYAYRVTISSGYLGNETHTAQGATVTFTTPGLPAALTLPPVLAQLPIPNVPFPKAAVGHRPGKKKTKAKKKKKHKKTTVRHKKVMH